MADDFLPIKRPKPGDGEEELIRLQTEYEEKKFTPCAKVINLRSHKKDEDKSVQKKSVFAQKRSAGVQIKGISTSKCSGNLTNVDTGQEETNTINNFGKISDKIILGNIVERKLDFIEFNPNHEINNEESSKTGFPTVFKLPEVKKDVDSKISLFATSISKNHPKAPSSQSEEIKKVLPLNSYSHTVSTDSLAKEIHEENKKILEEMSYEQILEEKKALENVFKPETLAFIKSLKNKKDKLKSDVTNFEKILSNNTMEVDENSCLSGEKTEKKVFKSTGNDDLLPKMDVTFEDLNKDLPETVVDIVKNAAEKGWCHMDDVESEKMKWMEDLTNNENIEQLPEESYNARFDFSGILMPFNDENLTVDQGLHHHGEEPERPGYSLQELLQLSRSAAQQQRCAALKTLANIMEKTHLGLYDKALHPSLLTALNEKNVFLLLRFSLDDTALSIITAALQGLRAFLFCEIDELCLDKIFGTDGFDEPNLKPSMEDVDDVQSLKDHELAQYDTVAVAMRSDIVLRIRFLLSEMRLPPEGMVAALEILARLARHSHETALNIACTPNLLDVIVKKCIPLSMNEPVPDRDSTQAYGCPLVAAVRLCRILIIYAGRPILERLKNLRILHSLLTYISTDASKEEVRLHIESLRLWRLFLHFGIESDSIQGARLTLISQLRLLESTLEFENNSPLKCDYAAALLAIAKYDEALKEQVVVLLIKWSTQMSRGATPNWNNTLMIVEALKTLDHVNFFHKGWIKQSTVYSQLSSSSNLLSDSELATERNPPSLPNLGVMTIEGKLQPIMSQHSNLIFLKTVLELYLKHSCIEEIKQIINNDNFKNYLQRLRTTDWSLERSWFTRIEYSLLVTLIQIDNKLLNDSETEVSDTMWRIAIKLISALPADCATNVRDILVFSLAPERINLRFLESGLENLDLNEKYKNVRESDVNLSLAVKLYEKFVSTNGNWSEAAMPKDWLYLPLIESYSRIKDEKNWRPNNTIEILNLLKLELIMPELTQNLSPNLRFSRILLLYLCDSTFVLPPESELPQKIFSNFIQTNYKRLDLAAAVPGLNSFTDLFTALCENFIANSYCQNSFSQVLLVFVAQRFEVHYRKLLWSEHAGALHYCRLTPDKLCIPVEEYLYPLEEDISVIESYITALVRNTVRENISPVLFMIALHHSAMYLKKTEKLAKVMRSSIEKMLHNEKTRELSHRLLSYEVPSQYRN